MSNQNDHYDLSSRNWAEVKNTPYDLALLPWGATEAHNYHLPYATDNYQLEGIIRLALPSAWARGAKIIVLPLIPYGINTGQMDVKLCMNMMPSTQYLVLKDICEVILNAGIHKLIILNGHGGNNFKNMIRELSVIYPNLFIAAADWYKASNRNLVFVEPGDHADEMETSAMLHLHPDLVRPLQEAGDGATQPFAVAELNEGFVTTQRAWTQITKDTGSGNPYLASSDKGESFLKACAAKISDLLVHCALQPLDNWYK